MENNKFSNFSYMFIDSSLKDYKEVLVTYKYRGLPHRKIIFIKEKEGRTDQEYLSIAKAKVETYIKSGKLGEFSRKRPRYGFGVLGTTLIATFGVATIALGALFTWKSLQKSFTVVWKNYDGTILEVDNGVCNGTMPIFNGKNPTRESVPYGTYTFSGWDKKITPVSGANQIYTAKYDLHYDENCTVYFRVSVPAGTTINLTPDLGEYGEVDWGDGTKNYYRTHTYNEGGNYDIIFSSLTGEIRTVKIDNPQYITDAFFGSDITEIPSSAFSGSSNLKTVEIAEDSQIKKISDHAFDNCWGLSSFTIPNSVTDIGDYAFRGCINLASINIPDAVKTIGQVAFASCYNLKTINISKNSQLETIGNNAFQSCSSLTYLYIPNGVKEIPWYSISYCDNLETVDIADGVEIIGTGAFERNGSLKTVNFSKNSRLKKILNKAFYKCGELASVNNISNTIESIGEQAFEDCYALTSFKLPTNSTFDTISPRTFANCSSLPSIDIPNTIKSIGVSAFDGCSSLTSFNFPTNPDFDMLNERVLAGCSKLTSIDIPSNVKEIGKFAFTSCSELISVTIPDSVTKIDSSAFLSCWKLSHLVIPNSVTSIADSVLKYTGITSIDIPDGITEIGSSAFFYCDLLEEVNFTNNSQLTTIKDNAFRYCESLTSFTIPSGVKEIGVGAFANCSSLTSITIPEGVEKISNETFEDCSNLETIIIPSSVKEIGNNAFKGCSKLTSITIPDGVTSIGDGAFFDCSSLPSINIPDSVTSIGANAFKNCSLFTSINIPDSVTEIKDGTFAGCTGFTSFALHNQIESIGASAFNGCSNLESFIIPDSVTSIGSSAFAGCRSIESIDIPISVTNMGESVFTGTEIDIYCAVAEKPEGWNSGWENGHTGPCFWGFIAHFSDGTFNYVVGANGVYITEYLKGESEVVIPGSVDYQGHTYQVTHISNDSFKGSPINSITIPASVVEIGNSAFTSSGLTSVTFAENSQLKKIGSGAFNWCHSLVTINIPTTVESIGDSAFVSCYYLNGITFGKNLKTIGSLAFWNCQHTPFFDLTDFGEEDDLPVLGGYFKNPFDACSEAVFYVKDDTMFEKFTTAPGWSNYASQFEVKPNSNTNI